MTQPSKVSRIMGVSPVELYFRNISRRWKRAISEQETDIVIMSPYITSSTAEAVLKSAPPARTEIHTVFSVENFVNGSSSVRTLRKLHEAGFTLKHLPQLHAKVVFVSGVFGSVGSQNLTSRGTRSREASVAMTEKATLQKLRVSIADWTRHSQLISREMLDEMEAVIGPLMRDFRKIVDTWRSDEANLFEREAQRVEAARVAAELEQQQRRHRIRENFRRSERLRLFRLNAAKAHVALPEIRGTVREDIFVPFRQGRFTRWIVDGRERSLVRLHRYLCVLPESGKIGWVKLLKTRLSKVTKSVTLTNQESKVVCAGFTFTPNLDANWKDPEDGVNLTITLTQAVAKWSWKIDAWFSVDSLRIVGHQVKRLPDRIYERIRDWLEHNGSELEGRLFELVVGHFRYDENSTGVGAKAFFSSSGYRVTIRESSRGEFIVAETL